MPRLSFQPWIKFPQFLSWRLQVERVTASPEFKLFFADPQKVQECINDTRLALEFEGWGLLAERKPHTKAARSCNRIFLQHESRNKEQFLADGARDSGRFITASFFDRIRSEFSPSPP